MKKKGISLIVLVITIIVIVILATTVIVTVVQNNPIAKAKEAVLKGDVKEFEVDLNLALANEKLNDYNFEKESVNAYEIEDIKKYIPSFIDKYYGKLCIEQGRLCFVGGNVTEEEKTMLEASGIGKGSYITKDQIDDIISKKENIPADATTTDITEYIDGTSPEQAEKFTIFQGNLYYRWEKTNMAERKMLHSSNIPFLAGDVNADGTLTNEDSEIISHFESSYEYELLTDNLSYIGDANADGGYNSDDTFFINMVLNGRINLIDEIDLKSQEPERIKFIGDYNKYFFNYLSNPNADASIENAVGYDNLVKAIPNITKEDAKRFSIIDGNIVYRFETLTDKEKNIINQLSTDRGIQILFSFGDGNFDGIVDNKDSNLIMESIAGNITLTQAQKDNLDVNRDGNVTASDSLLIQQYITGINGYTVLLDKYFNSLNK